MEERPPTLRSRIKRIAFKRMFPLWLDAFVLTWFFNIDALASLIISFKRTYDESDARFLLPSELQEWLWWTVYFLPGFLPIYVSALLCGKKWRRGILFGFFIGATLAAIARPHMAE